MQSPNQVRSAKLPAHNWVVLLNYNTSERVIQHLIALGNQDQFGIAIVDNNSNPADRAKLLTFANNQGIACLSPQEPQSHPNKLGALLPLADASQLIIFSGQNLGYSGGNNLAMRALHQELGAQSQFLIVNPDVELTQADIMQLFANPAEIVGPQIFENYLNGIRPFEARYDFRCGFSANPAANTNNSAIAPLLSGCCLKLTASALEKFGYLPDENFLYDEEIKYFERVNRLGGTVCYDPSITIRHIGSLSVDKKSFHYFYYIFRNRLCYYLEIAKPIYGSNWQFYKEYIPWACGVLLNNLRRRNFVGAKGVVLGVLHGMQKISGPYK